MKARIAARIATSLAITAFGIVAACRNPGPGPTIPSPLTPELSHGAPKPPPIDPKHQVRNKRVSQAAEPPTKSPPTDAGVSDVRDLPPVPDANVIVVRDAGQPLK